MSQPTVKPKKPKSDTYTIIRKQSAYVIVNQDGIEQCPENIWVLIMKKLEKLLREQNGI